MEENMKTLFPGHFETPDDELERIWKQATFVFDANILLNMYRYSEKSREEFLGLMDSIKSRIWVSHQAADEYFERRLTVIHEQESSYDTTVKDMNTLLLKFKNKRQHPFVRSELSDQLAKLFESIKSELELSKQTHSSRVNEDPIKERLAQLFAGKVGAPYPDEHLKEMFARGEHRYQQRIPPGFKDAKKSNDPDNLASQRRKFGDYILWQQTIDMAKCKSVDVILITDDAKEDWWRQSKGKTIGPLPALTKEFIRETGQRLQMYRADSFADLATQFIEGKISSTTVNEITQVRLDNNIYRALTKYKPLHDLIYHLTRLGLTPEDKLPSERDLADAVGYNRTVMREQLVRLESYGYVKIEQGKSTVLVRELPDLTALDSLDEE